MLTLADFGAQQKRLLVQCYYVRQLAGWELWGHISERVTARHIMVEYSQVLPSFSQTWTLPALTIPSLQTRNMSAHLPSYPPFQQNPSFPRSTFHKCLHSLPSPRPCFFSYVFCFSLCCLFFCQSSSLLHLFISDWIMDPNSPLPFNRIIHPSFYHITWQCSLISLGLFP